MSASIEERITALDWHGIEAGLHTQGFATTGPLLTPEEATNLSAGYAQEAPYRSRVVMARHGFGQGEYKYFSYPLPSLIERLRQHLYPRLASVANAWQAALGQAQRFPSELAQMLGRCHQAGQLRPTPLILKYGPGDHNCLHQDLYGDHAFPLQVAFLLSAPGWISRAATSSWSSNALVDKAAPMWCRCAKVRRLSLRSTNVQWRAAAASTAPSCVMGWARYGVGSATRPG